MRSSHGTDSSYTTTCTPLRNRFPVEVPQGRNQAKVNRSTTGVQQEAARTFFVSEAVSNRGRLESGAKPLSNIGLNGE